MSKQTKLAFISLIGFLLVALVVNESRVKPTATKPTQVESAQTIVETNCGDKVKSIFETNPEEAKTFEEGSKKLEWKGVSYNARIFHCPTDENYTYGKVLMITKIEGSTEKVVYTTTDSYMEVKEIKDINGDGLGEIVFESDNGKNCWQCEGLAVVQVNGDNFKEILTEPETTKSKRLRAKTIEDLNGDKIDEIITLDDSWENQEKFSHTDSPTHMVIWKWNGEKYAEASSSFKKFYEDSIRGRNGKIKAYLGGNQTSIAPVISMAIENYWDNVTIGKSEMGWSQFILQTNVSTFPKRIQVSEEDKQWIASLRAKARNGIKPEAAGN